MSSVVYTFAAILGGYLAATFLEYAAEADVSMFV